MRANRPDLKHSWARIRAAGRREIADRVRQLIAKRFDLICYSLGLGFHSPELSSWPGQRPQFFFSQEDVPALIDLLRQRFPETVRQIIDRSERICAHRFDLLGFKDVNYGRDIDWSRDAIHDRQAPRKPWFKINYLDFGEVGDVKVTWELNRHQHLVTLAKACRITGNDKFSAELFAQWYDWRARNPYPIGVNWSSSLEVGMRCLSWLWVRSLLDGCPVVPAQFHRDLLRMLEISGRHIERYLSTYFSPNTHLLGEAVSLFFIGTLCPEIKSARRWQERGWDLLLQESERQIRPDGMHFEQSTCYHVYALDFLLHAGLLAARNGIPTPGRYDRTIERMSEALLALGQAGEVPRLGDDDGGRVFDPQRNRTEHLLDPLATAAVIFGRGDFKMLAGGLREETLWLLGREGVAQFDQLAPSLAFHGSTALKQSGLYIMASSKPRLQQLVVDCGSQGALGAGHGHADALSVQLVLAGRPVLIDAGTGGYVGERGLRDWFRSTAAHNTLTVDGENQAPPRGPFAWASLADGKLDSWVTGENFDYFAGRHEGYARLPGAPVHRRRIFHTSRFWMVHDRVEGAGKHHLDVAWHLAPNLFRSAGQNPVFLTADRSMGLGLVWTQDRAWAQAANKEPVSPIYGALEAGPALHFARDAELPAEFAMLLVSLFEAHQEIGALSSETAAGVSGYLYRFGDEQHRFFFAEGQPWELGPWSSDAEFLYCHTSGTQLRRIVLCHGSLANFQGTRMLSSGVRLESCEALHNGEAATVAESRPAGASLVWWPSSEGGQQVSVGSSTGVDEAGN
jgi:hypothetical protein